MTTPGDGPSGPDDAAADAAGGAAAGGRSARRHRGGRDLPAAIASGVTLAAAFLGLLVWAPYALLALIALLVVLALVELRRALRPLGLHPATAVIAVAAVVMLFGAYELGPAGVGLGLVLAVTGAVVHAVTADLVRRRRGRERRPLGRDFAASALMACWVPLLAAFAALLLVRDDGQWLLLLTVALAVANDIGAWGAGVLLGRHKLAPTVSPGKTWEGFAGGLVLALAVAGSVALATPLLEVVVAVVVALAVVAFATVGDLTESLVKRDLGLKDLGTLIPGHGGVMDRVDAIVFALPAAHLTLAAFGV